MIIKRIKFETHYLQAKDLLEKHADEILPLSIGKAKLNIDQEFYKNLEAQDKLVVFGLFHEEELVGYLSIFVYNHHHHKNMVFAITDAFYVAKEYRGGKSIFELFKTAEKTLKYQYNVRYFYMGVSYLKDLKALALSLNYWPADIMYVKELE